MRAIVGTILLGCLATRPATAQRLPVEFRPLQPPPAYANPAPLNLPKDSDYTMEGVLFGGAALGLLGAWFAAEWGGGLRQIVTGGLIGATIGTTLGGLIGSAIPKGPCCREEPDP